MPQLEGYCAGCSDPIPLGALVTVGRFKTIEWAPNFKVQKPEVIFCQRCKHLASDNKSSHYRRSAHASEPQPESQAVPATRSTVQQMAISLYKTACAQPGTAKQLAQKAGIEYTKVIEAILKKLAEKNKLKQKGGLWTKA
jgi:hypothetical protein